jgi:hypothetical protein
VIRYHYHSGADSTLPRSDKIGCRRAIASLMPSHPLLAAIAAFAGHFAIDAIPHWDWRPRSIAVGKGADNRNLR